MYKFNKKYLINQVKNLSIINKPVAKLNRVQQDEKIMKPYEHIHHVPSKHHKSLCLAFNHWLNVPKDKVDAIGDILQTFHTATLLIDDVQDDSDFRYGLPAAHRVFSVGLTINAAITVMAHTTVTKVMELDHPMALRVYLDRFFETLRGQGIDLYWTDNFICPTEEEHIDMLKQKAGSFFVMAVQLLQLFSNSKRDYTELAMRIGVYYPIVDDYYNLFHPEALMRLTENNIQQRSSADNFCSDISECKFTLPFIHALQYPDVADKICDILKQRTSDPKLKRECISMLKKHGSDAYTRAVLSELETDIHMEINRLGGNPMLTRLMSDLSFRGHNHK
ncbi:terpene synthase-like isoform X2 [Epargyreus clarus]|uniref:terpene synthase-like isoform X2 n=1 Tax=Epargyreus clarus TaxID=520877 RepID=UPI003C2D0345